MTKLFNAKSVITSLDNIRGIGKKTSSHGSKIFNKSSRVSSSSSFKHSNGKIKNLLMRVNKRQKKVTRTTTKNKNISSISTEKSNTLARDLGFDNVTDFNKYINDINPHKLTVVETTKLSRVFKYLSKVAKKNPKSIAKLAIAGGTVTAMVIFLKEFQNKYSGCFRYDKNGDSNVKYKFAGSSWCNITATDIIDSDNNEIKILPENTHPLYNHLKWDCNYTRFGQNPVSFVEENNNNNNNEEKEIIIENILSLGCNGLCNWRHFNTLAKMTNGEYKPIIIKDFDDTQIFYKYIYKCETIDILTALSMSTVDALSDLLDTNLGIKIKQVFLMFILFILIYKLYFGFKKRNEKLWYMTVQPPKLAEKTRS